MTLARRLLGMGSLTFSAFFSTSPVCLFLILHFCLPLELHLMIDWLFGITVFLDLTTRSGLKKVHLSFDVLRALLDKAFNTGIGNEKIMGGIVSIYAKMCQDSILRDKLLKAGSLYSINTSDLLLYIKKICSRRPLVEDHARVGDRFMQTSRPPCTLVGHPPCG
jgi:hypothetical protein